MSKKLILGTIFLIFILLIPKLVFSTAAMEYDAINHTEKLCGGFWPGDEEKIYKLPRGWEELQGGLVRYNAIVKTPFGDCNYIVTPDNIKDSNYLKLSEYYPKCCEKLGFEYIDNNLINYNKEETINVDGHFFNCVFSNRDSLYRNPSIIINTKTNQCSMGGDLYFYDVSNKIVRYGGGSRETKNYCKFEDSNWIGYSTANYLNDRQEIYSVLYNTGEVISSVECNYYEIEDGNCCIKLGYTYIGSINEYYNFVSKKTAFYYATHGYYRLFYGIIALIIVAILLLIFRKKIFKKK